MLAGFFWSEEGEVLAGCCRFVSDFDAVERIEVVEGVFRTERVLPPAAGVLVAGPAEAFRTRLAAVVEADATLASDERRGWLEARYMHENVMSILIYIENLFNYGVNTRNINRN